MSWRARSSPSASGRATASPSSSPTVRSGSLRPSRSASSEPSPSALAPSPRPERSRGRSSTAGPPSSSRWRPSAGAATSIRCTRPALSWRLRRPASSAASACLSCARSSASTHGGTTASIGSAVSARAPRRGRPRGRGRRRARGRRAGPAASPTRPGPRTGLTIGLPEDIQMTMEAVAARELCNVYGSTETYGNCAVTDAHDALALRLETQGRPLPGMTIRVVDPESGRALRPGDVGEFRVKGHVTPGYFNDAEQTRAAFDPDGAFVTGDLGLIGDDGRVRFRGRLKELIKTGGINVAPLEVEAVLLSHSAVKQAYVVGVPDRARGELVVAAVELHDGATASAEALAAFCRERLAGYKVPARFVFRKADEFPRTPTGKVQKPRLRDELGFCTFPVGVRG